MNVLPVAKFVYCFYAPGMEEITAVGVRVGRTVRGTCARTQGIM